MTHFVQRPLPLPGRAITVDFDDIARQPSGHSVVSLCAQKARADIAMELARKAAA